MYIQERLLANESVGEATMYANQLELFISICLLVAVE